MAVDEAARPVRPDRSPWLDATVRELRGVFGRPGVVAAAAVAAAAAFAFAVAGSYSASGGNGFLVRLGLRLAVAAVAALLVASPWRGLLLWIVAMPVFTAARLSVWVGPWQVLLSSVLVGALLAGWLLNRPRPRPGEPRLAGLTVAGSAWLVAGAIVVLVAASSAAAANVDTAVPIALNGFVVPVLLATLAVNLRPSRPQVVALAVAFVTSVVLASAINLTLMAIRVHLVGDWLAQRSYLASLTYYNVGFYGLVLVMALPIALWLYLSARRTRLPLGVRWACLGAVAVFAVGIYLTYGKSAWIGAVIVLALFGLLAARTWRQRAAAAALAVALSVVVAPWPSVLLRPVAAPIAAAYESGLKVIQPRVTSFNVRTDAGRGSVEKRIVDARVGLAIAADHPLLGVGPGGYAAAANGPYRDLTRGTVVSPESFVIALLAETGVPLTILVGLAYLGAAAASVALWRHGERRMGAAFLAAVVGFAFVSTTFGLYPYRAYWVINSVMLMSALLPVMPLAAWAARPAAVRGVDRGAPNGEESESERITAAA